MKHLNMVKCVKRSKKCYYKSYWQMKTKLARIFQKLTCEGQGGVEACERWAFRFICGALRRRLCVGLMIQMHHLINLTRKHVETDGEPDKRLYRNTSTDI